MVPRWIPVYHTTMPVNVIPSIILKQKQLPWNAYSHRIQGPSEALSTVMLLGHADAGAVENGRKALSQIAGTMAMVDGAEAAGPVDLAQQLVQLAARTAPARWPCASCERFLEMGAREYGGKDGTIELIPFGGGDECR